MKKLEFKNYRELKEYTQKLYNEFSNKNMFFAFSNEQFENGLKKLNCTTKDIFKTGYGGFVLKSASAERKKLFDKMKTIEKTYILDINNLEACIISEMFNHEYCFNEDDETIKELLYLNDEKIKNDKIYMNIYYTARKKYFSQCEY